MSEQVQTTSGSLCKLVHWAHSHGTICSLIPSLQHLTCSSYVLTPKPASPSGVATIAVWGCSAGHAYHWPFIDQGNSSGGSVNPSQTQVRMAGGRPSNKVTVRAPREPCYSEAASEGEEFSSSVFDIDGCDSSATDDDADYEPPPSRKRVGTSGGLVPGKKVKQEAVWMEEIDAAASNTDSQTTHTANTETEPLGAGSCSTEQVEGSSSAMDAKEAGGQNELNRLQELLSAERSRTQQMTSIISSLTQDNELLQQELSKKAELICEFLQDQVRLEKRRRHSTPMEAGRSHTASADDVAVFDPTTLFDSFESELHPLEHPSTPKSKRNREGDNPRVRMKSIAGVVARYMTALQAFRRSVSMKVAFDRVGVDRNTISRTAAIAELSLAAPDVFHALAPWDEKEETLAHYAHRCRQAMDDNIKAKIKTMKAKGELLPIVSK